MSSRRLVLVLCRTAAVRRRIGASATAATAGRASAATPAKRSGVASNLAKRTGSRRNFASVPLRDRHAGRPSHDRERRHRRRRRRGVREDGVPVGSAVSSHPQRPSFSSSTGGGGTGTGTGTTADDDAANDGIGVEECARDLSRLMSSGDGGEDEHEHVAKAEEVARNLSPSARREVSDAARRLRMGSSEEGGRGRDGDKDEEGRRRERERRGKDGSSEESRVRTAFAPTPLPIPSAEDDEEEDEDAEDDASADDVVPEPSRETLRLIALTSSVPFVGFGFMDNFILILAGEAIDVSLGVTLGISTMCAAAVGNIVSDVCGVMLGTAIEDAASRMGLPVPKVTEGQRKLRSVRFAGQMGVAAGLVVGCVLGMCPLLWIDTRSLERKKKKGEIDGIFRSVVTAETRDLVGAEHVSLFFVSGMCDECGGGGPDGAAGGGGDGDDGDGRYLWAKYTDRVAVRDDGRRDDERVLRVPLDRKSIKRRVVMTGEAVNLVDAREDPDYDTLISVLGDATRSMMIVPVFNAHGEVIAVIQAMNKVGRKKKRGDGGGAGNPDGEEDDDDEEGQGFTSRDVQVLQALASHLSVYLGNADAEDGLVSFGDSIRRLKDHGVRRLSRRDEGREAHVLSDDEAAVMVADSPRGG